MMQTPKSLAARTFGGVVALSILFAACGGGDDGPLQIGIQRSALDLVFKGDEAADRTGSTQRALGPQPAPAHAAFATSVDEDAVSSPNTSGPDFSSSGLCPETGPDARPTDPVTVGIDEPPAQGTYGYHNTGTFEIEGIIPLEGPYPPVTTKTLRVVDPAGEGERFRTEVVQRGLGDNVTTTIYAVSDDSLELVRLHVKIGDDEIVFEPTPPVRLMTLGEGEGESWTSAGVDTDTGTSMVVEGSIEKREVVDLCGEVYETYRVVSEESIVNVFTGFRHETDEPTVYNVATHLGGLFLREDVDTTTTIPTDDGVVVVRLDYLSTANSVEPEPLG